VVLRRLKKKRPQAISSTTPSATPTPIPALAPLDKEDEDGEELEADEGVCVGSEVDVAVIKSDD
jgi:hypothetical protein